jgi:glycosyltransferase involved in cell wall biosynthesis
LGETQPGGPVATVVIPTHDRMKLLAEAVASVAAQSFASWELVVVDDASQDGTLAWLASLGDGRIRSVALPTASERAVARDAGLAEANGDYVLFLDDDDKLAPRALEILVEALRAEPACVAAAGARATFDVGGATRRVPHPRRAVRRHVWLDVLGGWIATPGQTLFRTAELRAAGGWDGRWIPSEDQELWLRLTRSSPALLVPEVVLDYRLHGTPRVPRDHAQVERRLRDEFVAQLDGDERRRAAAVVAARDQLLVADAAFARSDERAAFVALLRALRRAPGLARSPVTGPPLLASVAKAAVASVLGRRGTSAARRLAERRR